MVGGSGPSQGKKSSDAQSALLARYGLDRSSVLLVRYGVSFQYLFPP
jgi:hypothetical protein